MELPWQHSQCCNEDSAEPVAPDACAICSLVRLLETLRCEGELSTGLLSTLRDSFLVLFSFGILGEYCALLAFEKRRPWNRYDDA